MSKHTLTTTKKRVAKESEQAFEQILREGARRMLQVAVEAEVAAYIEEHAKMRDPQTGHRLVVRNGHQPERNIQTGIGDIPVRKPRVNDKREGKTFNSCILPRYMRRSPSVEALIPVLYLKGVSTNDFAAALAPILGEKASGLSPTTVTRLKKVWQAEYQEWSQRSLEGKRYVYWWVDGIYFNVRLSSDRPCLLVVMGTLGGRHQGAGGHLGRRAREQALVAGTAA